MAVAWRSRNVAHQRENCHEEDTNEVAKDVVHDGPAVMFAKVPLQQIRRKPWSPHSHDWAMTEPWDQAENLMPLVEIGEFSPERHGDLNHTSLLVITRGYIP